MMQNEKKKHSLWDVGLWIVIFGLPFCLAANASARDVHGQDASSAVTLDAITVTAERLTDYIRNHPQQCRANEHRRMIVAFTGSPWLSHLTPRQVISVAENLHHIHLI